MCYCTVLLLSEAGEQVPLSDSLQLLWPVPVVDRVTCNAALGNNIPALLCIGPSSQVLFVLFLNLITASTTGWLTDGFHPADWK